MIGRFATVDEDPEDRFRRHLPKLQDLTLVVLRGHLLAEEQLNGLLGLMMPNPDALGPARLEFFQRLCLARALLPRDFTDVFDQLEKLNTLRNKLAHNLEPPQIDGQIEKFLRSIEDPESPADAFEKEPVSRRLKRCIGFLCGTLSGIRKGYAACGDKGRSE